MGFDQWVRRDSLIKNDQEAVSVAEPVISLPSVGTDETKNGLITAEEDQEQLYKQNISTLDWTALESQANKCTDCELHRHRTQVVFGAGDRNANLLIIGEAPGEQEDLIGEPFIGRAGLLLNNMLMSLGLTRELVYIANVVKCRPPGNRDPHIDEATACRGYLQRQVELLSPSIILAAGRIAAQNLLKSTDPVGKMRGKLHQLPASGIPVIVTYHPAYLLRKPSEKGKVWEDLKLVKSLLETSVEKE